MWFSNTGGLAFRAPEKLANLALKTPPGEVPPIQWAGLQANACYRRHQRLSTKGKDIERRNVLVWFLLASGIPTRQVAELFELSPSRCLSLSSRCAQKYATSRVIARPNKRASANERVVHRLHQDMCEMLAAEELLESESWRDEVPYCLQMGRERFAQRAAASSGVVCECFLCTGRATAHRWYRARIYWEPLEPAQHTEAQNEAFLGA